MEEQIFISVNKFWRMRLLILTDSLFVLLFLTIIGTSCGKGPINELPKVYIYQSLLSFQDTSGNDLVSGIEFDFFNENNSWGKIKNSDVFFMNDNLHNETESSVMIFKYDYYYVFLATGIIDSKTTPNEIIFRLRCPHIFGDNGIHQIVTYWNPSVVVDNLYECYRIEYEGREITEIVEGKATIILDR